MVAPATACVALPRGLWLDGTRYREARLRPLSDDDELLLVDTAGSLSPARRATELLARCVVALGPQGTDVRTAVRSLTAGDREALLLHLRRLTLGDRIEAVIRCPAVGCGTLLDANLQVDDLLVLPPGPDGDSAVHERDIVAAGVAYRVRFRLPNGADLEAAAELVSKDPEAAVHAILRRCVVHVGPRDDATPTAELPAAAWRELSAPMAELDPQAEIELELVCPACGCRFSAILDAGSYFLREVDTRLEQLFRDTHTLALHYHWSEREIRQMSLERRQRYLQLLGESLAEARRR